MNEVTHFPKHPHLVQIAADCMRVDADSMVAEHSMFLGFSVKYVRASCVHVCESAAS